MNLCENLLWYTIIGVQIHELARVVGFVMLVIVAIQTVLAVFGVYADVRVFIMSCVLLCVAVVASSLTLDKDGVQQLKQQCELINHKQ